MRSPPRAEPQAKRTHEDLQHQCSDDRGESVRARPRNIRKKRSPLRGRAVEASQQASKKYGRDLRETATRAKTLQKVAGLIRARCVVKSYACWRPYAKF